MVNLLYQKFRPKNKSVLLSGNLSKRKRDGLGKIPADLRCIDSLLVFNSMINPYRHYQIIENVKVKKQERVKATDEDVIQLDKAPEQLNMTIEKYDITTYGYVPENKEM